MPSRFLLVASASFSAPEAAVAPEWLATALARVWSDAGVAAHGAAAAQAEFAAHLLRLGAPAPLLHGSGRALLDEAALSAAYLELARHHGAEEVRLTSLPRRTESTEVDRTELVLSTLRRACIAATVESSCAREALEHCHDPEARSVLHQVQHARARSAQLGWRFLGWALRDTGPGLADQVRILVLTALDSQPGPRALTGQERQLLRHGVLASEQRRSIEQRVLRDIVLPCMENALARARSNGDAA
jgi:hypothetical protein